MPGPRSFTVVKRVRFGRQRNKPKRTREGVGLHGWKSLVKLHKSVRLGPGLTCGQGTTAVLSSVVLHTWPKGKIRRLPKAASATNKASTSRNKQSATRTRPLAASVSAAQMVLTSHRDGLGVSCHVMSCHSCDALPLPTASKISRKHQTGISHHVHRIPVTSRLHRPPLITSKSKLR